MPGSNSIHSQRSRLGGHSRWAVTADRTAATEPGRTAFLRTFYDGTPADLPEAVRLQMAESARKAHFARLALKSALVRRARRDAKAAGASDETSGDGRAR